jgi:putative IMPACT (imprinted ancient) family translation regulator
LREVRETQTVTLHFRYSDQGAIMSTLRHFDLSPSSESFHEEVTFTAHVPVEDVASLTEQIRDRTAGRVEPVWDAPVSG